MDIQYLYEFTVLADAGNFLEAAERLFISQSSLSKHIKSLEKEFGATLFDRTTRRVSLNDAGHILLPYAKKIVIAENSAKDALRKQQEENTQTLTISSLPVMGQYNITALLADYKREFPKVILHIRDSETVDLKNLLERGKYDLAFMRDTLDDDDSLARIPFAHDTLAAILPITHPLANKEKISLSALKDESFIFLPTHTKISGLCRKACNTAGFEPRISFTVSRGENILDLISKGMGVSLMMKKTVTYRPNPAIATVDLTPELKSTISLCYHKNAILSPAAKSFVEYIKSHKDIYK